MKLLALKACEDMADYLNAQELLRGTETFRRSPLQAACDEISMMIHRVRRALEMTGC